MNIEGKGFVDERDDFQYVFSDSNVSKDNLGNFSITLIFTYYNNETKEYINDYALSFMGEDAETLYNNWNDLRVAYEKLVAALGIEVDLPESMNWELFE